MFRWIQDHIHKKISDRASRSTGSQSVEIATEAVVYDAVGNPEQVPPSVGGNSLSDPSRIQLQEQRQDQVDVDSLIFHTKKQDAERVLDTCDVDECSLDSNECSAKCLSQNPSIAVRNLVCNSSSSFSSMMTEEVSQDAYYSQENSSSTANTQKPTETTFYEQKIMETSSSLQKHTVSPSFQQTQQEAFCDLQQSIKSTVSNQQDQRESIPTLQEHKSSVFTQEHKENLSRAHEEHRVSTLYSQGCAEGTSSPHNQREDFFSTQKHVENSSSAQDYSENISISKEYMHVGSTSIPQEHTESNLSHQELTKTTATAQDNRESNSTPHQEPNENTHKYVEATHSTQHKESLSNSQKGTECTSNTQENTACTFRSPEHDTGNYSTNFHDLNNTQTKSCEGKLRLWSNTSLASPTIHATIGPPQDSFLCSEDSCVSQRLNITEKDRKRDEQQEKTSQEIGNDCTPDTNLSLKSGQDVNETALSHAYNKVASEMIKGNGPSNEELLNYDAMEESITHGSATGAVDQVGYPVPSACSETEFSECDRGSDKMEKNVEAALTKVDKCSQTQNTKANSIHQCPNPCCFPQACLYNQKGKKCTILGEHFILTYLRECPVLVSTKIENTDVGPMGCMLVWYSGKAIEFKDLPDGTEIFFDAIISPKVPSFVAIVIWQNTKPTHSLQPFFNCYVIVDLIRNCPTKFVSFSKENGVVSTGINGKMVKVVFSKSVVYIDGQQVKNASEIKDLSKSTSKQMYADVLKLVTLDCSDKVNYDFMCSCIWLGCKPLQSSLTTVYDPLKLYRKAVAYFPVASKQSLLLCDVDAFLEVEGTSCKIIIENEDQSTVLSCDKKKLFSGNERVLPVSGKVKVHLRKTIAKGACTWLILMVQAQPSSPLETAADSTQPQLTNETPDQPSPLQDPTADETALPHGISAKSSLEALPDATDFQQVTSDITERDVVLRPQYTPITQATGFVRKGIKPAHEEAVVTSDNISSVPGGISPSHMTNEKHMKLLIEGHCISESSGGSTLEEESLEVSINVEEQAELGVKENPSSYPDNVIPQDDQHTPLKLIRNGNGVLKNVGKAFMLETQWQEKIVHIEMGKTPWIAFENGEGKRCQTPMPDLLVGFDAHFVDIPLVGPVGHILALWSGKKPLKASLGDNTYYFDAPAVYHGSDEKGCFKFMVMLDGKVTFITTTSTTAIFEASGEHCDSLATFSHVFLHLRVAQDTWTPVLVVLQPKHKGSHLSQEVNSLSPKSISLPESETSRRSSLNSQAEAKVDNRNLQSATLKTSHVEVLPHYLRNLHGTLTETAGKRILLTHCKNIPLSVEMPDTCCVDINGVALNVKEISLETKLHVDAFCENPNSLRYWAAVVWYGKKPRKSQAQTGHIFYYNVSGRCLNSYEKEVSLELTVENKIEQLVCKAAYMIMPDGTSQSLEKLGAGTHIYVNLLQQHGRFSVNHFIYVNTAAAQTPLPPIAERKSEVTEKIEKEKPAMGESPNAFVANLKNSEVKFEPSSLKPNTVEREEVMPVSPDPFAQENDFDIARGTISRVQYGRYIFSDDKENLKVDINPMEIAVDSNLRPVSPRHEFYLVYHRETKVGMCGWYQHQTRQVYLQHDMIVHTHNLATKIITLELPDHSSLYNFLFDNEVTISASKTSRFQQELKSGKKVHPIIEDIKPFSIDGCVVSHRIVFMTTIKGVAGVCLNFLKHSLFGGSQEITPSNGSLVSKNNSLPKVSGDSSERNQYEYEGVTSSFSDGLNIDASFKQLKQEKQKNEPDDKLNESLELLSTSEGHSCSEISAIQPQINWLLNKYDGGNIPTVDGEGDTLRELISTKCPRMDYKTYTSRYVTLCGEIQQENSGTYVFCSRKLPLPVQIPPNLPHCDASMYETRGKKFMLARKIFRKETGIIHHQPLVIWPEERKCDPYIVVTYKVSLKKNLLLVTDAADEKEKWYLCDYNLVYSLKNSYKINEVIQSYSKQNKMLVLYAVVDNIPPFHIQGQYVEGNILFLSTSKNVAVSSIDVFIGSYHEEELLYQEPLSPISQMLHLQKVGMDRASRCERGSTCYLSPRESDFEPRMKLFGGCLEAHIEDFAIINCGRKSSTAVCHLSNVYYQGKNIASWETILKHHWKNFWCITLPLDDAVQEAKWEVDAVGLVAWCCHGPKVMAMHQCHYHVPTLYVPYHGIEESQETPPTNLQLSHGHSIQSLESSAGMVMSLAELESWECRAGSTMFAFHESILQSSGLIKVSGKITLVDGLVVIFTSTENEVMKCKRSDVFIKGKRCESVKQLLNEIDQTFTLVAVKCSPTIYLAKTIQMEVIIAFTAPLKLTGIHICNKHACILESSLHKEEIARADEAFHEIALLCEQSNQCLDYYLSLITTSQVETSMPEDKSDSEIIKNVKHTLCHGFVIDVDKDSPDHVRVNLQHGSQFFILPVSRSRLMGLHRDLSLQHAVGHPLKVILYSITRSEKEECRILVGWGNFSQESSLFPYSTVEPETLCSQKSKFSCCPRSLKVKEFNSLYNSKMYEVKSLYKLKKIYIDSGRGMFHYWLDEKVITCRTESIVGWPKVNQAQEELWNLLVTKAPQTEEEYPEAVAAWRGDSDSVVVEICDVHGIHGLNGSPEGKRKSGNKSIPSPAKRGRRNSEPQCSDLPASPKLMLPVRYRRNSLSEGVKQRQFYTTEEDDQILSRSFPYRTDYLFGSGLDGRSREYQQDMQTNFGSTTLLSIKEDFAAEEEKMYPPSEGIEPFYSDQPLCTSSMYDENEGNVVNLESERDKISSIVRPTFATIRSSSFLCLDNHHGLIIDNLFHTVALVRQGRLYINKLKPKESFKELFSMTKHGIITAVIVPLVSPVSLADLKVTHETVLAWLGSRPAGIGSMIKNVSTIPSWPRNLLQDKIMAEEVLELESGLSDPGTPYSMTSEVTKLYNNSLWTATVTLKVLLRKLETIWGCYVQEYAGHCGILMSSSGPILFERNLFSVTHQVEAVSRTAQFEHETENLKALVLELEQPIGVLGFEVKKIAVIVWMEGKPVIDNDFVVRSLDVYKMNWRVEIIGTFDQLEIEEFTKVLQQNGPPSDITRTPFSLTSSKEGNALDDNQNIVAICSPNCKVRLCTVLFIEDEYVVLGSSTKQILALWEDIWCQKEALKVGMQLHVASAKLQKKLRFSAHNFKRFAVVAYMQNSEPEEASTIKLNWNIGATEKFAQIRGELDSKMTTINLHVKIKTSGSAQSKPTSLQAPPQSLQPMEDMALAAECEILKIMDECGIMKVKNSNLTGEEIKIFFQRNAVLINNEILLKQAWKDTLQMLSEQKQSWQCSGQKLTLQERENIKKRTGEEVQYEANLVWCKTCFSAQIAQDGCKTVPGTDLTPKALSARADDFETCTTQLLTGDSTNTNETSNKEMHHPKSCEEFPNVHPSSVYGSVVSSSPEFLLHKETKTEGNIVYTDGVQSERYMPTPHKDSLWAARPTLKIVLRKRRIISECIVGGYADHCGVLTSAKGSILFDKKLINLTQQQDELASGTPHCELKKLKAFVLELEQPVEILGYEVRKIAMVVWGGEKPEVDNGLISRSLDVYKLKWIVVIVCNMSDLTKKFKLKKSVCQQSFYAPSLKNYDTSHSPEIAYYCSQYCTLRQHEVFSVSFDHVILRHQDSLALALRDDVKCSENYIEKGKHLWVIAVKLMESFTYCSHLITHFALLVHSLEVEQSEVAAIGLEWKEGNIEKVTSFEWKVSSGLAKVNIRVKVDKPADVRPCPMDPLWPLTPDRPEGDTIFAVECEVLKLTKNCGLLIAKGRMLKGKEVKIFFLRNAVLVNSQGLSGNATLDVQMLPVQKQTWRCTGQRIMPQEELSVKRMTGEEVQYKAKLVWCEICSSVQDVQVAEDNSVTIATESTTLTTQTSTQSGGASAWTVDGQGRKVVEEVMESLCEVDTPLTTCSKPKKKTRRRKSKNTKDSLNQEQNTRVGHLTEVHQTVAQLALEDEQLKCVAREKCFLYGVCLSNVELWHVLSIGLSMNYELTEDGKELKKVWVGGINLEPALLQDTLREWCLIHNVTPSATTVLLMEAGWLPSELTPTVAANEVKDVVEVTAPHEAFYLPLIPPQ